MNEIAKQIRQFSIERDWVKYHKPRSLILALQGELGELAELYQWHDLSPDKALVQDEIADVAIYLLRLADVVGVDLERAIVEKIKKNAEKYPRP